MRYRGGGVGHSSTGLREATNRFLLDRDRLDMLLPNGEERIQVEDDLDVDVADAGHVSGGDEDGSAGDGFGGDKEDDYGYEKHMDDSDDENSEEEPDLADDALGPEDGEGEGDETYLHGFAVL
jgi:hypothetical protein